MLTEYSNNLKGFNLYKTKCKYIDCSGTKYFEIQNKSVDSYYNRIEIFETNIMWSDFINKYFSKYEKELGDNGFDVLNSSNSVNEKCDNYYFNQYQNLCVGSTKNGNTYYYRHVPHDLGMWQTGRYYSYKYPNKEMWLVIRIVNHDKYGNKQALEDLKFISESVVY